MSQNLRLGNRNLREVDRSIACKTSAPAGSHLGAPKAPSLHASNSALSQSPAVYPKVQGAYGYSRTRYHPCRQCGIDDCIEVMNQETAVVFSPARPGFEVLFRQCQGTWPWARLNDDSPKQGQDVNRTPHRSVTCPESAKYNQHEPRQMQAQDDGCNQDHTASNLTSSYRAWVNGGGDEPVPFPKTLVLEGRLRVRCRCDHSLRTGSPALRPQVTPRCLTENMAGSASTPTGCQAEPGDWLVSKCCRGPIAPLLPRRIASESRRFPA